jgi:hypothetical protein
VEYRKRMVHLHYAVSNKGHDEIVKSPVSEIKQFAPEFHIFDEKQDASATT